MLEFTVVGGIGLVLALFGHFRENASLRSAGVALIVLVTVFALLGVLL